MAHEEIVFNGNTFVDNLKLILQKVALDSASGGDLQSRTYMDSFGANNAIAFLATFNNGNNPLTDWDTFIAKWKNFSGDATDNLLTNFVTDFKTMIGYQDGAIGDWSVLSDTIQGAGKGVTDAQIVEFFKRSFSHFIVDYQYTGNANGDDFLLKWTQFMTRTAEYDDGTSSAGAGADMAAFEQIYSVFFPLLPGETAAQAATRYAARIKRFFDDVLKETGSQNPAAGWFVPSLAFNRWFEDLREEFITQNTLTAVDFRTTVTPDNAKRVLVIDRILRLLISIIDTLQLISASQAQRLNFLTIWQQAYTELITDVPNFAAGDGTPLGLGTKQAKAFRGQMNTKMQSILEVVRARRSSVQDEAKAMQTTINQSQDAANQQTQMATALLQQLSTILSQIFR